MIAVYIMASRSRTLYIGVTSNLHHRVWQHKNGTYGGFTSKYQATRLVYYEEFVMMMNAIAREKQFKGWSRAKKLALIEEKNPGWLDLSEEWYHPASVPPKRTAGPSTPPQKPGSARDDVN
jgi:putative endonuclease